MANLCGDEPFWDTDQFLNGSWPRLTSCFQLSVLVWLPSCWLWVALPLHLYFLFWLHSGVAIATNQLNVSKMLLSVALCIVAITEMTRKGLKARSRDETLTPVVCQAFAVNIASYILTILLIHLERIKGLVASNVLWIFWCLSAITGLVPFYTNIYLQEYETDPLLFSLFYIKFFFLCLQLVLATCVEKFRHLHSFTNPEVTASVPSKILFWWITSFIYKTYKEGFQEEELFDLHPRDKTGRVISQFEEPWQEAVRQHQETNEVLDSSSQGYSSFESMAFQSTHHTGIETESNENTPLLTRAPSLEGRKKAKKLSLTKVLLKTYGFELLQSQCLMLIFDVLQFANPLLLGALINYAEDKRTSRETTQLWIGSVIAVGFFLVGLVSSASFNQCYHLGMTLGMRVKNALLSAVYKKSLSSSGPDPQRLNVEQTVKLMSVDCQRIQDLVGYLWMLWSAPFEITLASYLLWQVIGSSMMWGILVMILLMPINAYIANKQRKNLAELARVKDGRIRLTKDLVEGIQMYKMFTWERCFHIWIERIRSQEVKILKKGFFLNAVSTFCWSCSPLLILLATYADYVVTSEGTQLDAYKVFVTLALFNILRFPVNLLPMLFTLLYQGISTVERLGRFLSSGNRKAKSLDVQSDADYAVKIERGHFAWDRLATAPTLSSIDVTIPAGQLVAVVGHPGSGKSSFLSAIKGDMEMLSGSIKVSSLDILHVPQSTWVQSSSIKDNILFGKVKDKPWYNRVLEACGLIEELDRLPFKDKAEIGERGMSLSNCQKQRIALARAVYRKADIYLLDDPLCDVKSTQMADSIFNNILSDRGLLKDATRIIVTDNIRWLFKVDFIIMMTDGRVSETGTFEDALAREGYMLSFLNSLSLPSPDLMARDESYSISNQADSDDSSPIEDLNMSTESTVNYHRKFEVTDSMSVEKALWERDQRIRDIVLAEEKAEISRVKLNVFWHFLKLIGPIPTTFSLLLFVSSQGIGVYSNVWLSIWSKYSQSGDSQQPDQGPYHLGIYGAIGIIQAIFVIGFSIISSFAMLDVSRTLLSKVLNRVLRSPMTFFDQMSPARLLNRFSRDIDVLDSSLPMHIRSSMNTLFGIIGILVVISICSPVFLVLVIPIGLTYYLIQMLYVPTSRQLKNVESTTRTSIYTLFRDTIAGGTTIRTFKSCDRFMYRFEEKIDKNALFHSTYISTNRWLAVGVEFLGNMVVLATVLLAVHVGDPNESCVGLAVALALQVTSGFSWMVRAFTDLETNVYSVQRMRELTLIAPEAASVVLSRRMPPAWPQEGRINFYNFSTQPRADLYPGLKPLKLFIKDSEKVGFVGCFRSEALSIRDAIFRIAEATSGSIIIDNTIIRDLGLLQLRSRLTVLPLDPVLFSGSLQMNLDPSNSKSEGEIWSALEKAEVKEFFSELQDGLRFDCGHSGSNLSVKQRHQVCLARALLHMSKIIVVEDSKVALDPEIDEFMHNSIHIHFEDCTVLYFTYRPFIPAYFQRVVVIKDGQMVENGHPEELLQDDSSTFYHLVKTSTTSVS